MDNIIDFTAYKTAKEVEEYLKCKADLERVGLRIVPYSEFQWRPSTEINRGE